MTKQEHFEQCPCKTKGYNWMGKLVDGCTRYNDGIVVACHQMCNYMIDFIEIQKTNGSH